MLVAVGQVLAAHAFSGCLLVYDAWAASAHPAKTAKQSHALCFSGCLKRLAVGIGRGVGHENP